MAASYTGSFELRRLVVRFARTGPSGGAEDSVAFTVHFAKLTGGAVDASWLTADYTAVEARFDTWWTSYKVFCGTNLSLAGYTWYKDGPAWSPTDRADGPSNPAVRTTSRAVAATSANIQLPPQVALTITKIVDVRKRWGRLYLPGPTTGSITTAGTMATPSVWLGYMVTCFNGCRADGKQPVVWTRGRSAYTSGRGTAIAAHGATAYEITELRADNLFDVMRSRRWSAASVRAATVLT